MPDLNTIKPTQKKRIYDLVRVAGVDVSDWSNSKGGPEKAASNPKYCYEWAYVEPGRLVVLNLWYDLMTIRDGQIVYDLNMRQLAESLRNQPNRGAAVKRALATDEIIQIAVAEELPVRVVVCEGRRRNLDDPESNASRVEKRLLDAVAWLISSYNDATGECVVVRGAASAKFVDQFDPAGPIAVEVERKKVRGTVYSRSPEIRRKILVRAGGRCEWCQRRGFATHDGRVYLETHHIVPLSEGGPDSEVNVAALCPNDHREAHYGADRKRLQSRLLQKIEGFYAEQGAGADGS